MEKDLADQRQSPSGKGRNVLLHIQRISAIMLFISFWLPLSKEQEQYQLFPKKDGSFGLSWANESPELNFSWDVLFSNGELAANLLPLVLLIFLWPFPFLLFPGLRQRPPIKFLRNLAALLINALACYFLIFIFLIAEGGFFFIPTPLPGTYIYFLGAGLHSLSTLYEMNETLRLLLKRRAQQ